MSQTTISGPDSVGSSGSTPAKTHGAAARAGGAVWQRLRAAGPTALVIGLLVLLALWGHATDWTLPKFSSLFGNNGEGSEAWCKDHNVAGAECIECNPGLVPGPDDYGWCKVHGVAHCPLEHSDVAQLKDPVEATPAELERVQRALEVKPRAENSSACKLHRRRIQFSSAEAVAKAGIDIAVVRRQPVVESVIANAEIVYDENYTAHLASRVTGNVWRVDKQVGDHVRKGDVLALIDSSEVGRAKGEFLQAIAQERLKQITVDRIRPLQQQGALPKQQLQEAETALFEARIRVLSAQQLLMNLDLPVKADELADLSTEETVHRIRFLGLSPETISSLEGAKTSNLFPVRSPLDGVVVERKIVAGEVVDTTQMLFMVSDITRMWLILDVRQEDAKYLSLGLPVRFRSSDSQEDHDVTGVINWIATQADIDTRTVKVRVELPNDSGRLRANTFGTGRVILRDDPDAIVVPSEAVHWDGCCNVVFVRDKNYLKKDSLKFFHVRKVRLGVKEGDTTEIIAGLMPGEVIASRNSVVLEAQLLKSSLGAACCEAPAPKK